ncbi:MAG: type II toxin-antitoxin system HicB family antitoxin, partial [Rhodospirillaceae bacterium]
MIHFEGATAEEVLQSFRDGVDDYLALRAEHGAPVEAGGALMKTSLSVVDMLRQDGPEADFDFVPPSMGTWSRLEATLETGFDLGGGQLDRETLYTRTVAFIAFLRKDDGSDYGVEFPDVPGCVSAGRTLEEVRTMAAEALAGHIAVLKELGMPVPVPSAMETLRDDPRRGGAEMILVEMQGIPRLRRAAKIGACMVIR